MTKSMKDIFPSPEEVLKLEPEELAVFLLEYLCEVEKGSPNSLNRYNFTLQSTLGLYAEERYKEVSKVMTEAWIWLEREGMIVPMTTNSQHIDMNKDKKKVYIKNFGWPLVTVARDGSGNLKEDKCFGVNGLGHTGHNFRN